MKQFVLAIAFISALLFTATSVVANPIPVPALIMPEEYIYVTISHVEGTPPLQLLAKVDGTYHSTIWDTRQ